MGRNNPICSKPGSGYKVISSYLWGQKRTASTPADWLIMRFNEITTKPSIKPLSPEQARLKSMKDRVKRDQQAVKAERARQKIKTGQQALTQLS